MLRDALQELLNNPDCRKECKVGRIISDLDDETAKILVSTLRSEVPTVALVKTLSAEGIKISREFLGSRRQCFKDASAAKGCCISQKIKEIDGSK